MNIIQASQATRAPQVIMRPIASLQLYVHNARVHSKRQIKQIAASIERFGFTNPVLIGDDGAIIAGHGRVAAAGLLRMTEVPTLALSHLSPAERRAYVLADNKLALNAGWDSEVLAIELQGLIDLEFDAELTGFALAEITRATSMRAPSPLGWRRGTPRPPTTAGSMRTAPTRCSRCGCHSARTASG